MSSTNTARLCDNDTALLVGGTPPHDQAPSAATTAAQATLEEEQVARMTSLGRKFEESLRVTHETRVALEEQVSTMSAHERNLQDLLRVAQDKAHLAHVLESTDHSSASRLKR
ncbi:hypothetical protein H257_16190 [Aphanomyces astaci]|uniref:Uncharacterized protein n=1 Tax=Aphanomyces astaci TaxID=112090 RepID=W4FL53_APHAT|nr:hypothetical protein H257_16190 [Aphanomyces astaci]ETV67591.1 hypothetical protein H257_16190 [Aphanomyces astaci]|eukprot:XP_009842848.1 hypothetical protein H257_16190 [Aphanomyces astaci]